ncbi:hypothetical protein H7F15_04700 [Pontibacter sp. Tf4]|uniref:hypothetical protein n=1 Tax=Pontibacter sp. Tf4 TaxID=2761620 RepID=UPI0016244460|nr:hypothetical protein [Pontibacter sp. Tf4]MBB6610328.1 hypothetical protein [Pontibacter sp. Tf4]
MVGFVVPFRGKANSKNWHYDQLLLQRTINSILNQIDRRFKIFLVYTDYPELDITADLDLIEYIKFPFEYMSYNEMVLNIHDQKHAATWLERNTDKGKKILWGCKYAIAEGCTYIMQVDSDDLISNKIVSHVLRNQGEPGWYISKGYIYIEKDEILIKQPDKMNFINGSTHIIKAELVNIPDFTSKEITDYYFFNAHGYLKDRIKQNFKLELKQLPFYANVYVASGYNQSNINALVQLNSIKNFLKLILRFKLLTSSIRNEFGLYALHE